MARLHAVLNNAETIDAWRTKGSPVGGEGTPEVAEFSPATLAARLGISTHAGRS